MDDHAPEKTQTVKKKTAMPLYNDEIKRDRRKATAMVAGQTPYKI